VVNWLIALVLRLVGLVLDRPEPALREAEAAGAAQARLQAREAADEKVGEALAAARAADAADAADPAGQRRPDPDCRDCGA
jgi:hypothetical protein